ncbi:MAG TPA: hypothetical protein PKY30_00290 [Myxococcota bacterium]|nr:hypothetical protein [Myxococcota bacterium]HND28363.1 hypothetical protein [Myxococcota bacterium]HNH45442.1 hypothetical protein [Myxococcota bacterium]
MRRFHLLPVLAIFACLGMGADTRQPPARAVLAASPAEATPGTPETVTVAAERPVSVAPLRRADAPDPAWVRRWCSLEEQGALELATSLRTRAAALEERERLIDVRAEELKATEKRLIARLSEIKKLREEIALQLDAADQSEKTKVDDLVKMVEANRPSNIAAMFEALDEPLAVQVLDRMNPTKAGKLLAALNPITAARLAGKMARPVSPVVPAKTPEEAPAATPATPTPAAAATPGSPAAAAPAAPARP